MDRQLPDTILDIELLINLSQSFLISLDTTVFVYFSELIIN